MQQFVSKPEFLLAALHNKPVVGHNYRAPYKFTGLFGWIAVVYLNDGGRYFHPKWTALTF